MRAVHRQPADLVGASDAENILFAQRADSNDRQFQRGRLVADLQLLVHPDLLLELDASHAAELELAER